MEENRRLDDRNVDFFIHQLVEGGLLSKEKATDVIKKAQTEKLPQIIFGQKNSRSSYNDPLSVLEIYQDTASLYSIFQGFACLE